MVGYCSDMKPRSHKILNENWKVTAKLADKIGIPIKENSQMTIRGHTGNGRIVTINRPIENIYRQKILLIYHNHNI